MLTFIFLFFFAVIGIAAYLISIKAKRRSAAERHLPSDVTDHAKVGRAVGSGDD